MKKRRAVILFLFLVFAAWAVAHPVLGQEKKNPENPGPELTRAVMCESIEALEPHNTAVAFSIGTGKISCFTSFEGFKSATHAWHRWYRRDALVTAKRLILKPPSWSTYSSIQLREADKGPWRVEITTADNRILKTLRFSVTD